MMALRWADKLLSDGLEVGWAALALRWAGLLLSDGGEVGCMWR